MMAMVYASTVGKSNSELDTSIWESPIKTRLANLIPAASKVSPEPWIKAGLKLNDQIIQIQ